MVGICAMTKKSKSKPMTQILERLCKFDYIDVVIFPEEVILEEPVEKWPLCDCLISFHSKGEVSDETQSCRCRCHCDSRWRNMWPADGRHRFCVVEGNTLTPVCKVGRSVSDLEF